MKATYFLGTIDGALGEEHVFLTLNLGSDELLIWTDAPMNGCYCENSLIGGDENGYTN